ELCLGRMAKEASKQASREWTRSSFLPTSCQPGLFLFAHVLPILVPRARACPLKNNSAIISTSHV
ncbi:hypothetical protein ACLOJK_024209, partial [Asimina triloba]